MIKPEGSLSFSYTLRRKRLIDPVRCAVDALGMGYRGSFLRRWDHEEAGLLSGTPGSLVPMVS